MTTATPAPPTPTPASEVPARSRKARVARWGALVVGVVFVAFAVVLATRVGSDPSYRGGRVIDQPAPAIDLPALTGGRITSADLQGKAVIVNFWNTWCIPCQKELPALKAFAEQQRGNPDVVFVGIVRDDTEAAVRTYVTLNGITWPVAFDPDARAAIDFGTTGQPETYAISPTGIIVAQQFGEVTLDSLNAMLLCARGVGCS